MPAFAGVDYLDFDSLLNDEELLARRTARHFVDEQVLPIIEKHNREATFPLQLVPQLAEQLIQRSPIVVRKGPPPGAAEDAPLDDAIVRQGVVEDQVALRHDVADHRDVGDVAAHEDD